MTSLQPCRIDPEQLLKEGTPLAKVIVVVSQKGGVGKTTLVCHLAFAAAQMGQRVLVVDLDTQMNASLTLSGSLDHADETCADQLFALEPVAFPSLRSLSTDSGIEILTGSESLDWIDGQCTIGEAIARTEFVRTLPFDRILIDTPPSLGMRHLAPLLWAHAAYVPVEPSEYSTSGLAKSLQAISLAKTRNPRLAHELIINKYKLSSATHRRAIQELTSIARFRSPYLCDRIAISIALAARQPVWNLKGADTGLRNAWKSLCEDLVA